MSAVVRSRILKQRHVTDFERWVPPVGAWLSRGRLKGNEVLPAKVKLTVGGIDLSVEIEGLVELG